MKCWVGFSKHDSFVSDLIAKRMKKEYSHVFLLFPCNDELLVLHATGKGVNALEWSVFKEKNSIVKMIEVVDECKAKNAYKYCISKLGKTYGFLAVLAIGLGIHYEDGEKTLICSEYVLKALDLKFNKLQDLVTPADIESVL